MACFAAWNRSIKSIEPDLSILLIFFGILNCLIYFLKKFHLEYFDSPLIFNLSLDSKISQAFLQAEIRLKVTKDSQWALNRSTKRIRETTDPAHVNGEWKYVSRHLLYESMLFSFLIRKTKKTHKMKHKISEKFILPNPKKLFLLSDSNLFVQKKYFKFLKN